MDASPDPFDTHWAVTAIDAATRGRALRSASQWHEAVAGSARRRPAIGVEDAAAIADLATAYDLAALEAVLGVTSPMQLSELALMLRPSADRAFTLRTALPPETIAAEAAAFHRLHGAALAILADRVTEYDRWAHSLPRTETADELASLRAAVASVWVELLVATQLDAVKALVDRIAALREKLTPAATLSPRELFQRQALQSLLTAAGELVSYLTGGERLDVIARVAARLHAARAGAPADTALAIVAAWLMLAATRIAHRLPEQLSLLEAGRA